MTQRNSKRSWIDSSRGRISVVPKLSALWLCSGGRVLGKGGCALLAPHLRGEARNRWDRWLWLGLKWNWLVDCWVCRSLFSIYRGTCLTHPTGSFVAAFCGIDHTGGMCGLQVVGAGSPTELLVQSRLVKWLTHRYAVESSAGLSDASNCLDVERSAGAMKCCRC